MTRTQIEHALKSAQQEVRRYELCLASLPPEQLILNRPASAGISAPRTIEFRVSERTGLPQIIVTRTTHKENIVAGTQIARKDVPAVRAWLDHYYPPATPDTSTGAAA